MITGVGTGRSYYWRNRSSERKFPNLKSYAVEPTDSPVLSGGNPGPASLCKGIGAGFVPKVLNSEIRWSDSSRKAEALILLEN